jgi:hypothetical protein
MSAATTHFGIYVVDPTQQPYYFESSDDEPNYIVTLGFQNLDSNTTSIGPQDRLQSADFREVLSYDPEGTFGKIANIDYKDGQYVVSLNANFAPPLNPQQDDQPYPVIVFYEDDPCAAVELAAAFVKKGEHPVLTAVKENLGITLEETAILKFTAPVDSTYSVQAALEFEDTDGISGLTPGDVLKSGQFIKLSFDETSGEITVLQSMLIELEQGDIYRLYFSKGDDKSVSPADGEAAELRLSLKPYGNCIGDTTTIKVIAPIMKLPKLD